MQLTAAQRDAMLADLIATGKAFDPAASFVGVFVAISDHGLATAIGDITPPPTSVAVRQAITAWGAVHEMLNGCAVVDGPAMSFSPASSTDACVVTGWFLASAITAGDLLGYGYFPAPISLPDEFSEAGIIVRLALDPNGQWDANVYYGP